MNEKISKLFTHIKKNSRKIKLKTSKPMKNIMEMSRKIKIIPYKCGWSIFPHLLPC